MGATLYAMGRADAALDPHRTALALAETAGDRYEQARALDGMAHGLAAQGDPVRARDHWRRALEIYQALGVPEAEVLSRRLSPPESPVSTARR